MTMSAFAVASMELTAPLASASLVYPESIYPGNNDDQECPKSFREYQEIYTECENSIGDIPDALAQKLHDCGEELLRKEIQTLQEAAAIAVFNLEGEFHPLLDEDGPQSQQNRAMWALAETLVKVSGLKLIPEYKKQFAPSFTQ